MSISPLASCLTVSFCSLGGLESADGIDHERIVRHPLLERAVVLLGQHGRRHQDRHLLAIFDRLERGPHRQLGFAVTDVAAQQAIHRPGLLHVLLDLLGAGDLIDGRLVGKLGLELLLPFGIRRIGRARLGGAGRLDFEQLGGHVHDRFGDLRLLLLPHAAAQPRELRMAAEPADVFLDQIDPRRRHVQRGVLGEAQREIFLALALLGDRVHARELGDAVGDVDDVVAGPSDRGTNRPAGRRSPSCTRRRCS